LTRRLTGTASRPLRRESAPLTPEQQRDAEWRRLASGPPGEVTVDSLNGRLTVDTRDSVIGAYLYKYGAWEYDLIQRTGQALRDHGLLDPARTTLIDVGANIGTTTVTFLREGTFDRALAVEPDARNFELLQRNVEQNDLAARTRCLPIALGAAPGVVELEMSATNFGDHRVRRTTEQGEFGEADRATRTVEMARLDDVLDRQPGYGIDTVGLLWIDVQGFEGEVLKGAPRLLSSGVPVEMELWPYGLARGGTTRDSLIELLAGSFTTFIDLRSGELQPQPIDELRVVYDRLSGPRGDTEILLFRT
jgi:FkbM family methyltransferase